MGTVLDDNALTGLFRRIKMSKQYLSCADTAKLVRAALKESFPGVKFSVRSSVYSGGASINVGWVDGPNADQVKSIASAFEGSYFDGMTDYKGSNYGSLDGQEVRFGADFIFVNRLITAPMLTRAASFVLNYYGLDNEVVIDSGNKYSGAYIKSVNNLPASEARGFSAYDIQRRINEEASKYSLDDAAESATLNRIGFLGDDGYGYGAVGRIAA
jgi:hypothetical protein